MFRVNQNMNPVNDVISLLLRQPRSFLLLCFFLLSLYSRTNLTDINLRKSIKSTGLSDSYVETLRYHWLLMVKMHLSITSTYILDSEICIVADEEHQHTIATRNETIQTYLSFAQPCALAAMMPTYVGGERDGD
jgi:hypothetical protein